MWTNFSSTDTPCSASLFRSFSLTFASQSLRYVSKCPFVSSPSIIQATATLLFSFYTTLSNSIRPTGTYERIFATMQ